MAGSPSNTMYASLMPDLIGIDADPLDAVALAASHGFAGIDLRVCDRFARFDEIGADALAAAMRVRGLRAGYCSLLPGKLGCDEAEWRAAMAALPRAAEIARTLGYTRTSTVVLPFHETLPFGAALQLHIGRVREAMPILRDWGLRLGLEYVSPLTRRAGKPHPFIHDLRGALRLVETCGDGVGLMLDSFHWHCANETEDDLASLPADLIVVVHLNDAIAGRPMAEQRVDERELPGATGVIDLAAFMRGLQRAGYDGPITAEPTHPRWRAVAVDEACCATSASLRHAISLALRPSHQ